jgi:hypothetical protein
MVALAHSRAAVNGLKHPPDFIPAKQPRQVREPPLPGWYINWTSTISVAVKSAS